LPPCHSGVFPLDHGPESQWSRGELHPGFPRARRASSYWTTTPFQTAVASQQEAVKHEQYCLLLTGCCRLKVTGVGVEPTLDRLSTCRLCRLAYPVVSVRGPGIEPGDQAYETRASTSPPRNSVADPGVEPGKPGISDPVGHRPVRNFSGDGGSRTHTVRFLRAPPLPVGPHHRLGSSKFKMNSSKLNTTHSWTHTGSVYSSLNFSF
jgi:hypothetical protein